MSTHAPQAAARVSIEARPRADEAPVGAPAGVRRVLLLGSTGSIGTQTVEVIRHLNALHARGQWPQRYEVVGLAAGRNAAVCLEQAREFGVRDVALADGNGAEPPAGVRLRRGPDAAERLVREVECDLVLAAMVGFAGLPATLAAVQLGRDVALANKETLVAAGGLVVPAAARSGSRLLPVDSEHCAVWMCLQGTTEPTGDGVGGQGGVEDQRLCPPCDVSARVSRVILTASGGPFRTRSRDEVYHATAAEAMRHPTWNMGPKVTIDSASLTNKALEVIEAHWLFGLPGKQIGVLVHPQSIVHSIVEYPDGSAIAQLAPPDMRTPIQYALTYPARPAGVSRKFDWAKLGTLEFAEPDFERFPALGLAWRVIEQGGTAGAVMNAANEAAVEAFIAGTIPFGRIPELTTAAMDQVGVSPLRDLRDAEEADAEARRFVSSALAGAAGGTR